MTSRRELLAFALCVLLALPLLAQTPPVRPGNIMQADADEESTPERKLVQDIRADLVAERFDSLDRLANSFRTEKSRWPGGAWKLRTLYSALDAPHLTDGDTVAHLDHLRHWMTQRPESVTARIALAQSLKRWAWVARGNGTAETVTATGWQLFNQRIEEARVVLDGSANMRTLDPEWFEDEMIVGKAQGWDDRRDRELFERAIQFEPEYQYFYKSRAIYLLPKWYGQEDDATNFAKEQADRAGGDFGDYLYWEIATAILHRGNGKLGRFVKQMDWARIRRGYAYVESHWTATNQQQNLLAFMAREYGDRETAQAQFAKIQDHWSRSVWRERRFSTKPAIGRLAIPPGHRSASAGSAQVVRVAKIVLHRHSGCQG